MNFHHFFSKIESLLAEKDFQKQQLEGIINRQQKITESKSTETESSIDESKDKINELNGKTILPSKIDHFLSYSIILFKKKFFY